MWANASIFRIGPFWPPRRSRSARGLGCAREVRMHPRSVHRVAQDAAHFNWDHSIAPVLEIESGEDVELEVRDASGGQLDRDSELAAVAALDFNRVNPVTGPVFVKGAT